MEFLIFNIVFFTTKTYNICRSFRKISILEFVDLIKSNNSLSQHFFVSHVFCLKNEMIEF